MYFKGTAPNPTSTNKSDNQKDNFRLFDLFYAHFMSILPQFLCQKMNIFVLKGIDVRHVVSFWIEPSAFRLID